MSVEQLAMLQRKGYAVHLVTQRNQPYGSVRRCCEICGVMVWPERQGDDTPMYVTSDEDYVLMENQRCDRFNVAFFGSASKVKPLSPESERSATTDAATKSAARPEPTR